MVHKVYLLGAGLGNPDMLTVAAMEAIQEADLLIGAERLLDPYRDRDCVLLELVKSDEIVDALRTSEASCACILLSGDLGFYSGATLLRGKLEGFDVVSIPGISSLVYFCAKIGTPWQDAHLVSAHGRDCMCAGEVQTHEKTFFLTGGTTKVADVCTELVNAALGDVRVWAGERLSYDDERIVEATAEELAHESFDDLAVMLVLNEHPIIRYAQVPCLSDYAFSRGDAPMTKEEVRELVLAKLALRRDDTVWDIGAGTGSISVEAALAANAGSVYAVEKDEAALELLAANKANFGVTNMHIISGAAPEALQELPAPDRVFIGGSSGQLASIVQMALSANPQARIVMTAITLETLSEALTCIDRFALENTDIVQLSVSKAKKAGRYHMMTSQNPIYIMSADAPAKGARS
jgi:precorrin-6Y C5,15-methyltransferase (decarboxylating)